MRQYILKRLLLAIPTLIGVSLVVFFMLRILPGDIVQQVAGDNEVTPEVRARIEEDLGLDRPAYEEYFDWLGGVLTLDFGRSLRDRTPINDRLSDALPTTIEMAGLALIISLIIALPVGIISAIRQDTIIDYVSRSVAIGALAIPTFWLGTMIIVFSSNWFNWATPLPADYRQLWEDPWANLQYMIFPFGNFIPLGPSVVLGVSLSGTVMRLTRTQMLEVQRQDYVRTAWAKGLHERSIIVGHALKNALIPVVTVVGLQIPILVGGSVVVESIYNVPGIGQWFYAAMLQRDYTVVQGIALLTAVAVVLSNLLVDVTYAYLDPRIRYS
ncbi:MAG TPA: ABC transporter permease [Dehalococcoidia bacterium]|jgi:peptide/nickel transport system permease protein|nr:ABC transporter permease [Dehalococcoidia bacterium]